jgi:hypothetical protein
MEPLILHIKDEDKYLSFLQFIKQLDFVEVKKITRRKSAVSKYDFFASAGLWKNKGIDAKELRTKAWNR